MIMRSTILGLIVEVHCTDRTQKAQGIQQDVVSTWEYPDILSMRYADRCISRAELGGHPHQHP